MQRELTVTYCFPLWHHYLPWLPTWHLHSSSVDFYLYSPLVLSEAQLIPRSLWSFVVLPCRRQVSIYIVRQNFALERLHVVAFLEIMVEHLRLKSVTMTSCFVYFKCNFYAIVGFNNTEKYYEQRKRLDSIHTKLP